MESEEPTFNITMYCPRCQKEWILYNDGYDRVSKNCIFWLSGTTINIQCTHCQLDYKI